MRTGCAVASGRWGSPSPSLRGHKSQGRLRAKKPRRGARNGLCRFWGLPRLPRRRKVASLRLQGTLLNRRQHRRRQNPAPLPRRERIEGDSLGRERTDGLKGRLGSPLRGAGFGVMLRKDAPAAAIIPSATEAHLPARDRRGAKGARPGGEQSTFARTRENATRAPGNAPSCPDDPYGSRSVKRWLLGFLLPACCAPRATKNLRCRCALLTDLRACGIGMAGRDRGMVFSGQTKE